MEKIDSYQAGFETFIYIAVMVIIWVYKAMKKMQKNQAEVPYQPVSAETPVFRERKSRSEVFGEETQQPNDVIDWVAMLEKEKQALEAVRLANEQVTVEAPKEESVHFYKEDAMNVERFDSFVIKEEKKNIFADLLDDPANFKKAFVLSEILNRKY